MYLEQAYGSARPCIHAVVVEVTIGKAVKSVYVYSVEDIRGQTERAEAKEILDLYTALRDLFDTSDAADWREYARDFVP